MQGLELIHVSKKGPGGSTIEWRDNERDGVSNNSFAIVYSTVYSGADQRKPQS